jgi:hypothetical protein
MLAHAPRPVLVLGPIATPDDIDNLRGYAFDVADQLGVPAVYATHNDYRVTDFGAVYVLCASTELHDTVGLLLVAEALAAGIEVYEPQAPREAARCLCGQVQTVRTVVGDDGEVWCAECRGESVCGWCGEWPDMEDVEIVEGSDMWVPLHAGCLEGMRRATSTSTLPVAA